MPCMHRLVVTPSAILCHSPYPFGGYERMSMNPGATTRPVAFSVVEPTSGSRLMRLTVSPSIPTWATASKPVSGSMTRPPATTTSWTRSSGGTPESSRDGWTSGTPVVGVGGTVLERGTAGSVVGPAVPAVPVGVGRRRRKAIVAAPKPTPRTKRRRVTADGRRSSGRRRTVERGTSVSADVGPSWSASPGSSGGGVSGGPSSPIVGSSIGADASGGAAGPGAGPPLPDLHYWLPLARATGTIPQRRAPRRIGAVAGRTRRPRLQHP